MSARLRRLKAEFERLEFLFRDHDRIRVAEALGDPPDKYVIEYRVRGLVETKSGIEEKNLHRVQISLGPDYPRVQPECVALDPIFHPNIDYLAICTADVSAAGQKLEETIIFIGEMIMYQAYNLQSPRNGDARVWTEENLERLPLENVELRPRALLEGAELPIAPAVVRTVESAAATELLVNGPRQRCLNCGRQDSAALAVCSGGHVACADCRLGCSNCGQVLCVLCEVGNCTECRRAVCADCLAMCSCGRQACPEHAWQCSVCGSIRCRACPVPCCACGTLYCQEHLDENKLCPACQQNQPQSAPLNHQRNSPGSGPPPLPSSSFSAHAQISLPDETSPVAVTPSAYQDGLTPMTDAAILKDRGVGPRREHGTIANADLNGAHESPNTDNSLAGWDAAGDPGSAAGSFGAPAPSKRVQPVLVITEQEAMSVPESALAIPEPWRQIDPIESPRRSGKAIASFLFGILGMPCLGLLVGWFAVLFGIMALKDIKRNEQLLGRRLANLGVAFGVFDIVLWIVLFAAYGPSLFVPRFGPTERVSNGHVSVLRSKV